MSYIYWNNFIDNWRALPSPEFTNLKPTNPYRDICGWSNPNLMSLLASDIAGDLSLQYIPEPWWGNNGTDFLESVVVNYNPWVGSGDQHHSISNNLFGSANYNSFVSEQLNSVSTRFKSTNSFHKKNRASRIFNTLKRAGISLTGEELKNHLSVELIPWHTPGTETLTTYFRANLPQIFNNRLLFAAEQSKKILNNKLKNKVIVRISASIMTGLLIEMRKAKIVDFEVKQPSVLTSKSVIGGKGGYMKFNFTIDKTVEYFCIWGIGKSKNDFPPDKDMDWIFANII